MSATERVSPPVDPTFTASAPATVAAGLDRDAVHLWRVAYRPEQGRAPLRALLGAYLGVPTDAVILHASPGGKPQLAATDADGGQPALEFNWSHSGAMALIALAWDLPLGVDIEHLGKRPRALEIANRYFDPGEAAALAALDEDTRKHAFIALWCAKEALLKAAGTGLSFGLARLAFHYAADNQWQLARTDPALGRAHEWAVSGFRAAPDYRGALAWRGAARPVRAFELPEAPQAASP